MKNILLLLLTLITFTSFSQKKLRDSVVIKTSMFEIYIFILFVGMLLIGIGFACVVVGTQGVIKERCWTGHMTAECLEKNLK
jgi:hypothetical protein